jgi:dihydroxyacid dehydratase/phosphogluconate dehydratase
MDLERIAGTAEHFATTRTRRADLKGGSGSPRDAALEPSGNLFGMTQDAGKGWNPADVNRPQVLIVSTQGGLRGDDGRPVALGFHTGHWEIGLLVRAAAETLREAGVVPFAASCSDPCDGRTQGTAGMFDSLPYRNDAAITMRRLIRSLPRRVIGIATCDKGLPATMLALAGCGHCSASSSRRRHAPRSTARMPVCPDDWTRCARPRSTTRRRWAAAHTRRRLRPEPPRRPR